MTMSWEQTVTWLQSQPGGMAFAKAHYLDDPLAMSAARFAVSDEWKTVREYLPNSPGLALDIGAGRGISSYALAHDGWRVTAVEPDPSPLVGANAIRALAKQSNRTIEVVEQYGEQLPFDNSTFDVVYCRQVLHHAYNLPQLCQEGARVLKPGGCFIATREHVIDTHKDLDIFLENHPLHKYYGKEYAYTLKEYVAAINTAGLQITKILRPLESVINYYPMPRHQWQQKCSQPLARCIGDRATHYLTDEGHPLGCWILHQLAHHVSKRMRTPGRLYSFVAKKSPQG